MCIQFLEKIENILKRKIKEKELNTKNNGHRHQHNTRTHTIENWSNAGGGKTSAIVGCKRRRAVVFLSFSFLTAFGCLFWGM